jgi:hypothetical protein
MSYHSRDNGAVFFLILGFICLSWMVKLVVWLFTKEPK